MADAPAGAPPDAPPGAPGAPEQPPGPKVRTPLDRPQTPEELAFYARNHWELTVLALILFLPLGLPGLHFSREVKLSLRHCVLSSAYHRQLLLSPRCRVGLPPQWL